MVNEKINSLRLKLNYDGGMNEDKQIIKSKTYNRVKKDASSNAIYAVGLAIGNLHSLPLLEVIRLDEKIIEEE